MAELAPRKERFCQEYAIDLCGKRAATDAGYSPGNAENQAARLLAEPAVKARVAELIAEKSKRTGITADRVLEELARVALFDLSKAYDSKGHLLPLESMPEDMRRAIVGIKVFEEFEGFGQDRVKVGEVREVKTADKVAALKTLLHHLKPPVQKHEVAGKDGEPIQIARALSDEQLEAQIIEKALKLGFVQKGKK